MKKIIGNKNFAIAVLMLSLVGFLIWYYYQTYPPQTSIEIMQEILLDNDLEDLVEEPDAQTLDDLENLQDYITENFETAEDTLYSTQTFSCR